MPREMAFPSVRLSRKSFHSSDRVYYRVQSDDYTGKTEEYEHDEFQCTINKIFKRQ